MKRNLKNELACLGLIALPLVYLMIVWNELPDLVPIHWNHLGEIDGWESKYILWGIPFLLPGLIYAIFLLIQRFSPAEKLERMGKKFNSLKFILTLLMSLLALFVIHSSKAGSIAQPTFIFVLLGLVFASLGNFFKTIQPNYFLGIRTPWTLRHESVWKSTHEFGGKLWFVGGLLIALLALVSTTLPMLIALISIIILITIIPIIYSYRKAKALNESK